MSDFVTGVVLDHSLLLSSYNEHADPSLHPSLPTLLRKLRYSNIKLGISFSPALSDDKVSVIKNVEKIYSRDCLEFNVESLKGDAAKEMYLACGGTGGRVLYVVSKRNAGDFGKLIDSGWLIVVIDLDGNCVRDNSSLLYINKLEELLLTIFKLNRKAVGDDVVAVGYVMKPSREEDFAKRGSFPLLPTPNGLMFLPLTFEVLLPSQLQHVDIVLHKSTDEIISVELCASSESANRITYSKGMQDLQRFVGQSGCFVIDPFERINPVLDRLKMQEILLGLEDLNTEGRCRVRGPHFLKVDVFNNPDWAPILSKARLSFPCIVKPQVACGVADSHSMAIVFRVEDFQDLSVPLPAVIQEYVDHSSTIFKIYVLGEKVFYAVKKSMPNADILTDISERNGSKPLMFDSLKSLPTSSEQPKDNSPDFDFGLVTDASIWLARKLDLTIFGFDIVIQEGTRDHVVVDVNYLPSFKEVADDVAIPAFWNAIRQKFESRKK